MEIVWEVLLFSVVMSFFPVPMIRLFVSGPQLMAVAWRSTMDISALSTLLLPYQMAETLSAVERIVHCGSGVAVHWVSQWRTLHSLFGPHVCCLMETLWLAPGSLHYIAISSILNVYLDIFGRTVKLACKFACWMSHAVVELHHPTALGWSDSAVLENVNKVLLRTLQSVAVCWCFDARHDFCSDGVIRVFTSSAERMASPTELAEYEQSVAASEIPAQIGDIKTEDLVGPSALQVPGNHICVAEWSSHFFVLSLVYAVDCAEVYWWSCCSIVHKCDYQL